jgi:peptidoglycan/xylan/chitin deacetylase (PgdA/CDA1 family)
MAVISRRHWFRALIATAVVSVAGAQAPAPGRTVAITIDDGPVVNESRDLGAFQRITNGLIASFQAEKVPVTIFINERQLNVQGQRDGRAAVVQQWLDAGFELGNHTYSHRSANQVPVWQFHDDIVRGSTMMNALLAERGRTLMWFRYPFLHSGTSAEIHQAILDFLEQRGYKVAHVTVDYADYRFAGLYSRLLRSGREELAAKVKQAYLNQVDVGFDYAEKASIEVYGREIPQILLIHCNELNSLTLRDSITRIRNRGYSFISLDEATRDPAYQRPDSFTGPGGSWLSRTATLMGKTLTPGPQVPQWINELAPQLRRQQQAPVQPSTQN